MALPILRCACGVVSGNPKYPGLSYAGQRDHQYRVRKFFEAAIMKRPLPPVEDLVEAFVCLRCLAEKSQ